MNCAWVAVFVCAGAATYRTACGHDMTCEWVTPMHDGFTFCPFCGKAIVLDDRKE